MNIYNPREALDPGLYSSTLEFSQQMHQGVWHIAEKFGFHWNELFNISSGMRMNGERKNYAHWCVDIGDIGMTIDVASTGSAELVQINDADLTIGLASEQAAYYCGDEPNVGYCRLGTRLGRINWALGDISTLNTVVKAKSRDELYRSLLEITEETDPIICGRETSFSLLRSRDWDADVKISASTDYMPFDGHCYTEDAVGISYDDNFRFETQVNSGGFLDEEVKATLATLRYKDNRGSVQQLYTATEAAEVMEIGRRAIAYPLGKAISPR